MKRGKVQHHWSDDSFRCFCPRGTWRAQSVATTLPESKGDLGVWHQGYSDDDSEDEEDDDDEESDSVEEGSENDGEKKKIKGKRRKKTRKNKFHAKVVKSSRYLSPIVRDENELEALLALKDTKKSLLRKIGQVRSHTRDALVRG